MITNLKPLNYSILLVHIPVDSNLYMMGVASLKAYLELHDKKCKCIDPVSSYYSQKGSKKCLQFTGGMHDGFDIYDDFDNPDLENITDIFLREIKKYNPQFLGFSLISGNRNFSLYFAKKIKQHLNIPIVLGGVATLCKAQPVDLSKYDFIDYIIRGEGEKALLELLESKQKDEKLSKIGGLVFRHNNVIVANKPRELDKDLSQYPFADFSDYFDNIYFNIKYGEKLPISLSRGCPFNCSFCSVRDYALGYRAHEPEACLQQIKKYTQQGYRQFEIVDSICNADKDWLENICIGMIDNKLEINWVGSFKLLPQYNDQDLFFLLAKSGCSGLMIGLESASSNVLKHMRKFHNLAVINEILDKIRVARKKYPTQLKLDLLVISGYPTEKSSDLQMTLDFIKKNKDIIDCIICSSFILGEVPELTDTLSNASDLDLRISNNNFSNWSTRYSSPSIRLKRLQQVDKHCKELNIPCEIHHKKELENILKSRFSISSLKQWIYHKVLKRR